MDGASLAGNLAWVELFLSGARSRRPATRSSGLRQAGVVRQVTLGRRNRAFEAVGPVESFTGFERTLASPEANTRVSPPTRHVPARQPARSQRQPASWAQSNES